MKDEGNRICARRMIWAAGELASPLLVGSGENEDTDMDLITAPEGTYMIPGSSLAGAMRAYLTKSLGKEKADFLFGNRNREGIRDGGEIDYQSSIFVYDVMLKDGVKAKRNGVRLDCRKTAEELSRYDMQILEPGAKFWIRLELTVRERRIETSAKEALEESFALLCDCLSGMENGVLRVGAKSRRGYGKLHIAGVSYCDFIMDREEDFQKWLDFDWNRLPDEQKSRKSVPKERKDHCLRIPLKVKDTILIRDYYLKPMGKGGVYLDYGQLVRKDERETAVIPGSSWAGAVRSYLAHVVQEAGKMESWETAQEALEPFFGTWKTKGKEKLESSKLLFEESKLTATKAGEGYADLSRNSIDRLFGGTVNGALYHERIWAGGETELVIRWQDKEMGDCLQEVLYGLLYWVICGLYEGFLTVGGETAVGRGAFECPKGKEPELDGTAFQPENAAAAIKWFRNREEHNGKNS